jgi:hypothetical protein
MVAISVKPDVRATTAALNDIVRKQIPFATKTALNDVAFLVQTGERINIQKVFTSPRPFTVKSVLVNMATKARLTAVVYIRTEVAKYLQPYETGGVHVLPGTALLEPKNIPLDQYGQLRKNTPARLRARKSVFVGTVKGITGFWLRLPIKRDPLTKKLIYHIKLLIRFGDALPVHKHLEFHERAVAIVKATFRVAFNQALRRAFSTAKKP